jgi:hypothetical protein
MFSRCPDMNFQLALPVNGDRHLCKKLSDIMNLSHSSLVDIKLAINLLNFIAFNKRRHLKCFCTVWFVFFDNFHFESLFNSIQHALNETN